MLNIRDVAKVVKWNMEAGITSLVKSPPGFGKTDLAGSLARWFKDHPENQGKRIGLACFFMATQSPIGFTGLPWKGEKTWKNPFTGQEVGYTVTDPAIPQWYMAMDMATGEVRPANLFDHVFLVIEEWGQGGPDTKKAGAEVLRAKGTPPFYLPKGSPCLALSNVDQRDGVTKEFDFTINRVDILEMSGDAQIWVDDFADKPYEWDGKIWNVTSFSKSWALQHGNEAILFEGKPEKQGPWCSPRSYTSADRLVQVAAKQNGGVAPVDSSLLVDALAGLCGMNLTQKYMSDMQFAIKLPSYDTVVADPTGTEVPKKSDLQMLMAYEMAGKCKTQDLGAVLTYIKRLPPDMNVTFVTSLLRKDYKGMINEPAMKAWIAKNAAVMSVVSSLAAV